MSARNKQKRNMRVRETSMKWEQLRLSTRAHHRFLSRRILNAPTGWTPREIFFVIDRRFFSSAVEKFHAFVADSLNMQTDRAALV